MVTALGLVVAELVTNSFDHAFPDGTGSTIVSLHRAEDGAGMATLTVSDNGLGFTAKAESKRHGLGLVHRLMEQVSGTASVASEHGTVWTMRFPDGRAFGSTKRAIGHFRSRPVLEDALSQALLQPRYGEERP